MIDYQEKFETMTIECEKCSFITDYEGTWKDCVAEAKEDGWRFRKVDEEWQHLCPNCK